MIKDHTLDQALIELTRTLHTLQALRAARKSGVIMPTLLVCTSCASVNRAQTTVCMYCDDSNSRLEGTNEKSAEHAAALRASLDLSRKLADLRQGR